MKRNEVFELLELFKTKANEDSHLYDVYHGKPDGVHLWFIYGNGSDNAQSIASFRIEDIFPDEEYLAEIMVRGRAYEFIEYKACKDLINTLSYETQLR